MVLSISILDMFDFVYSFEYLLVEELALMNKMTEITLNFNNACDDKYRQGCSKVNKDFTLLYKVLINKTSCYMIKLTNMAD